MSRFSHFFERKETTASPEHQSNSSQEEEAPFEMSDLEMVYAETKGRIGQKREDQSVEFPDADADKMIAGILSDYDHQSDIDMQFNEEFSD